MIHFFEQLIENPLDLGQALYHCFPLDKGPEPLSDAEGGKVVCRCYLIDFHPTHGIRQLVKLNESESPRCTYKGKNRAPPEKCPEKRQQVFLINSLSFFFSLFPS